MRWFSKKCDHDWETVEEYKDIVYVDWPRLHGQTYRSWYRASDVKAYHGHAAQMVCLKCGECIDHREEALKAIEEREAEGKRRAELARKMWGNCHD